VLLLSPWLYLIPMGIWRGLAVEEPCDRKALDRYGVAANVFAISGAEHVRLWPPAWVCPLANGDSVSVSILG
jgi:hypothetical protein